MYYWAYQDMERAHETALITESFPDEYKKEGYWQTLAALCIITGDTTRARTIMDKKTFAKDDQTRFIFDMLMSSLLGDCAKGAAMLDTVRTNYKSIPSDRLTSLKFALGSCQLESGEYEAAIANLQEITSSKRMLLDFGPYYPAAHFLLAKAYDASGDIRKAIDQYRFFLTLWEQSDPDLPFRRDAEARVAELEAASNM